MTRPVVADTGPPIALATVGRLELLHRLYDTVVIPPAVHAELALGSDRAGARVLEEALAAGWLTVCSAPAPALVAELARLVDPGEAEAIAFAEREPARFLLVDDARARRVARRRGIAVVGVAGMLAVVGRSIAVVEEQVDDQRRDAALLHPALGVLGVHGSVLIGRVVVVGVGALPRRGLDGSSARGWLTT